LHSKSEITIISQDFRKVDKKVSTRVCVLITGTWNILRIRKKIVRFKTFVFPYSIYSCSLYNEISEVTRITRIRMGLEYTRIRKNTVMVHIRVHSCFLIRFIRVPYTMKSQANTNHTNKNRTRIYTNTPPIF